MEIKIDNTLVEALQQTNMELNSIERLIGSLMSATEYDIPQSKIEELMAKHVVINTRYDNLKSQVSEIVSAKVKRNDVNWNLDFTSGIVSVLGLFD